MTDRYCVIGNPIEHSKSPEIHAAFAAQTGQDLSYQRWLAPKDGFGEAVRELIAAGFRGANVTVPFKVEAAALAPVLSERARAAGAVNTLSFVDGDVVGDNTDGAGLVNDILRNAGARIAASRILLLGAGGAARGVVLPLLHEQPQQLVIANRTRATADALAQRFAGLAAHSEQLRACDFGAIATPFDIVINATSSGLAGDMPPVPAAAFGPGTLAVDMMYGKPSPFLAFAARHGANTRDGLGMLVEQAAEAFSVWRGVRPATAQLLARLRAAP